MCTVYIAKYDWTEADEQYWWSITYPDYPETKVRPAYEALKAMPK
jgi:polysaccharide biosynthesis protein PslG